MGHVVLYMTLDYVIGDIWPLIPCCLSMILKNLVILLNLEVRTEILWLCMICVLLRLVVLLWKTWFLFDLMLKLIKLLLLSHLDPTCLIDHYLRMIHASIVVMILMVIKWLPFLVPLSWLWIHLRYVGQKISWTVLFLYLINIIIRQYLCSLMYSFGIHLQTILSRYQVPHFVWTIRVIYKFIFHIIWLLKWACFGH